MTRKIIEKSTLVTLVLIGWASLHCHCQDALISHLQFSETAPPEILASRSIVLYDYSFKKNELEEIQKAFQKIGIDAIAYFEGEKITAGRDPDRAHSDYFNLRQIKFLILLRKTPAYEFLATSYNGTNTYIDAQQSAWKVSDVNLSELLLKIYRDSWLSQKKENFLINDAPEMGIPISTIVGRRSELYPIDLKIDNLAVPRLTDPALQEQLENLFAASYPYNNKYKMVDVPGNEKDLRKLGYQYVLCFVHSRGIVARELLGYDLRKESAYGSVTYPNSTPQLKTISVETPVYKFYIKHVESGNVFLGPKWDADETLIQSLKNHLYGFRSELKLN